MSGQCSAVSRDPKLATRWHGGRIGMGLAEGTEGRHGCNCGQKAEHGSSEIFLQKHKMGSGRSGKYSLSLGVATTHLEW